MSLDINAVLQDCNFVGKDIVKNITVMGECWGSRWLYVLYMGDSCIKVLTICFGASVCYLLSCNINFTKLNNAIIVLYIDVLMYIYNKYIIQISSILLSCIYRLPVISQVNGQTTKMWVNCSCYSDRLYQNFYFNNTNVEVVPKHAK